MSIHKKMTEDLSKEKIKMGKYRFKKNGYFHSVATSKKVNEHDCIEDFYSLKKEAATEDSTELAKEVKRQYDSGKKRILHKILTEGSREKRRPEKGLNPKGIFLERYQAIQISSQRR